MKRVLIGALVVGGLDLLDAIVFFGLRNGVPPVRIFQSIAAGVQGRAAFSGGVPSAALGILLHFFIAFVIVGVYLVASRYVPVLIRQWIVCGILYGIAVYFFMNDVVIPLSATTRGAFAWPVFVNGLAIHMLGVGLPAAWFAARR
jgi:uncharacterized membrane protein YagU involved in acid resistance